MEFHYIAISWPSANREASSVPLGNAAYLSQPVSIAIKRFEQQIGGALFLRNQPKYSECTPTELAFAIKPQRAFWRTCATHRMCAVLASAKREAS